MGIGRKIREQWRDRDLHFEIKNENANEINQRLYLRGLEFQKPKRREHNRKATRSEKAN